MTAFPRYAAKHHAQSWVLDRAENLHIAMCPRPEAAELIAAALNAQTKAPSRAGHGVIRVVAGGTELTHFEEVRDGERWQAADGVEHMEEHGHRLLAAKAVSKFLIPSEPDGASRVPLPLADETGAVEALRYDGKIVRVIFKAVHAADPITPAPPASTLFPSA